METIPQDLAEKIDSLAPGENLSDICFADGKPNLVGKLLLELYDWRNSASSASKLASQIEHAGLQGEEHF